MNKLEQELRNIRDKWFMEWGLNPNVKPDSMFPLTAEDINTIQSETYNLGKQAGRDEVINEIEEYVKTDIYNSSDVKNIKIIPKNLFIEKLEKLKEQK